MVDGPADPVDDEGQDDGAGNDPADDRPARRSGGSSGRGLKPINDGAGWVLGLLLWGWVGLPFIKGGPPQVKKVLMAKFFNKAPDGSFLP